MAENQDDIFEQFKEFLAAKRQEDADASQNDDYEVEVFDEKGRGARLRRSHARPFLNSLGIDLPETEEEEGEGDTKGPKKPVTPKKSTGSQRESVARKYFVKKTTLWQDYRRVIFLMQRRYIKPS